MKAKKIIVSILSALCLTTLSVGLASCGENVSYEKKVTEGEPKYEYSYSSYFDGDNDPDILIDGNLTEDCWKNKKWYTSRFYTDTYNNMPMISSTAFNTEYGVYIGVKIRDNNITYSGMLDLTKNSVLEYYFYANKNDVVTTDNDYSQRRAFMMDYGCDLYSTGERMKRAVVVDGELNSGETKGATFEIFIPWSELDIDVSDGVPEKFFMVPAYRPVLKGKTAQTPLFNVPFNLMNHITGYYVFDENGYTDQDAEGAIVGDSINGTAKTGNWDIENVADKEVSVTSGLGNNTIFFKDAFCENFEAEATLYPLSGDPKSDTWWVGGFLVLSTNGANYMMTLQMGSSIIKEVSIEASKKAYALKQYALWTLATRDEPYMWNQKTKAVKDNPEAQGDSIPTEIGTKFSIVKYGTTVCYFINGEYLYSETLDLLQGEFYVGLFNMNGFCAYKELSFKEYDDEEAKARLEELHVYSIAIDVMTAGGDAVAECEFVNSGDSAKIEFTNYSGYKLSSVKCNDVEIINAVKANAVDGVYTIENVSEDIHIEVEFEEIENAVIFTGDLLSGDSPMGGKIIVISKASGALKYEVAASMGGFEIALEPGEYKASVDGYYGSTAVTLVEVPEDLGEDDEDPNKKDVAIEVFDGATELYSGTTVYEFGGELTYKASQTGAMVLKDVSKDANADENDESDETVKYVEIEQGKPFMIYADVRKSDLTGVGFVVGTLGTDNSKHIMFNWRPIMKDIYITRESYGGKWGWTGHEDGIFSCKNAMKDINHLALVYINGAYLFVINGDIVANIPEKGFDNRWGGMLELSKIIGEEGNKKIGLSVLIGTAGIAKYGYETDENIIKDYLNTVPLYENATITKEGDAYTVYSNGANAGAFVFDDLGVDTNEDFMVSVKVDSINAENVGFVLGTLANGGKNHLMFQWRANDVYIWRGDPYGWTGHDNGIIKPGYGTAETDVTLAIVRKAGRYYLFINGNQIWDGAEDGIDNGWGGLLKLKNVIGTEGTIKFGLSVFAGSATFSDFDVTTDAEKISVLVPDKEPEVYLTKLYGGEAVKQGNVINAKVSGGQGAFLVDETGVDAGSAFMISVKVDEIKADNIGFVVGTLGSDNKQHMLFQWRANDIYISREGSYGWTGHKDGIIEHGYGTTKTDVTLALAYKDGRYYMFFNGTKVWEDSENGFDNGWGGKVVIKNYVGTEGTVKFGVGLFNGTATFSDFNVTTDAAKINAAIGN